MLVLRVFAVVLFAALAAFAVKAGFSSAVGAGGLVALEHEVGRVKRGVSDEFVVLAENATGKQLVYQRAVASCGCVTPVDAPAVIASGDSLELTCRYDTRGHPSDLIQGRVAFFYSPGDVCFRVTAHGTIIPEPRLRPSVQEVLLDYDETEFSTHLTLEIPEGVRIADPGTWAWGGDIDADGASAAPQDSPRELRVTLRGELTAGVARHEEVLEIAFEDEHLGKAGVARARIVLTRPAMLRAFPSALLVQEEGSYRVEILGVEEESREVLEVEAVEGCVEAATMVEDGLAVDVNVRRAERGGGVGAVVVTSLGRGRVRIPVTFLGETPREANAR